MVERFRIDVRSVHWGHQAVPVRDRSGQWVRWTDMRDELERLRFQTAQLRHAYTRLLEGCPTPGNYKEFANGLIAPAIRRLEELVDDDRGDEP